MSKGFRTLTLVLIASVVQLYLLGKFYFAEGPLKWIELCIVFLVLLLPFTLNRKKLKSIAVLMTVTATFGGLGMIFGQLLDTWLSQSNQVSHHHHTHEVSVISWSNVLMILFCFTACFSLCPTQLSTQVGKVVWHLLCSIAMFIGMVTLGSSIANTFLNSLSAAAGNHIAMLIGMQIGACIPEFIRVVFFQREYSESCHSFNRNKRFR